MARAEQNNFAYLFRLRMTANVRRSLDRAMGQPDWSDAGQGWQGKETLLRLQGWIRQRRVILLRRKLARELAVSDKTNPAQPRLGFVEVGPDQELWEYAALVTSLDDEILTLGQLYRDRADSENVFDELKNQWGWGGFTTQDHRVKPGGMPDALPAARRHSGAGLQLVEPVHPPGRSRASSRGDHQPAIVAVGHRAANPARRSGDPDYQQHARHARQGAPGIRSYRRLPG